MSPRAVLPISLYVADRRVLLVGSGALADERADRLRAAGAALDRVAAADYRPEACDGAMLVLAHTDDAALDRAIAADARTRGCLAYAHDQPEISDLAMPALVRRGPLAVAISTDGRAPALARRLREELGRLLDGAGPRLDALVAELAHLRATLPKPGRAEALYAVARRLRLTGDAIVDD